MKPLMMAARGVAMAIAVVALIDPAITSGRRSKPEIAVVAERGEEELATRVDKELSKTFTIIHGPFPRAAATVIVGETAPSALDEISSRAFVVAPARVGPSVSIETLSAPTVVSLDSRVPVQVLLGVSSERGKAVDVTLSAGGLVVGRSTQRVVGDGGTMTVPLTFVPAVAGPAALRVVARADGAADSTVADFAVDVRDHRWSVLFFDPRPSWMSTFVRRALEVDRRFAVASRVVTSKSVSTDAGQPPSSLEDPSVLELYDAIVIGAPEALTARDIAGVETFLRRRGGGVVLLFDERLNGTRPVAGLTGVDAWGGEVATTPMPVNRGVSDTAVLRATEAQWPVALPPETAVLATAVNSGAARPVIWQMPVGGGTLVVSGALDGWKFRDATTSGFDAFWRSTIGDAANQAHEAVAVSLSRTVARPGEPIALRTTVRDAVLADPSQPVAATVTALLDDTARVELWPEGVGQFVGRMQAPAGVGSHRLTVTANGSTTTATLIVTADPRDATHSDRSVLAGWVAARGGAIVSADRLESLSSELQKVVTAQVTEKTWHPMRGWWWLVVFVGLLGTEWWWRRKQGLG